jgi:hypothetical protein
VILLAVHWDRTSKFNQIQPSLCWMFGSASVLHAQLGAPRQHGTTVFRETISCVARLRTLTDPPAPLASSA